MPEDCSDHPSPEQWQALGERCPGALPLADFLEVACGVAKAVCEWHAARIAHGGINDCSLQVAESGWRVRLCPPGKPALPYLAPEQSARLQRRLDPRSDCYALGVVYYRLLTGRHPFQAADPLEWLHAHVACMPVPPHRIAPGVPLVLSEIVMKMLAKAPEQRYRRIDALHDDLLACADKWHRHGDIERFPIGATDLSGPLQPPQRLVGRDEELAVLRSCYAEAAGGGKPQLVLVSGHAGVGKSALIGELEKIVLERSGIFLAGKFDPVRRHMPYATLVDALRQLIHTLTADDQAAQQAWRTQFSKDLGDSAPVLVELFPCLHELLGPQADPPEPSVLAPGAAQPRLFAAIRRLFALLVRAAGALVLFLDDLHWADTATLALLEYVLVEDPLHGLLVVGAYRDSEGRLSQPLTSALARFGQTALTRRNLYLAPLDCRAMIHMLDDMLRARPEGLAELADLVHHKTGGNALFALQFMRRLEQSGLLGFDAASQTWRWNLDAISRQAFTDNVVELMVENLKRTLHPGALAVLQHAACLGQCGSIARLGQLQETPDEPAFRAALQNAVEAGIIELADEHAFRFTHDRFQQAVYSTLSPGEREALHVRIARLMASQPEGLSDMLFETADHYNLGAAQVDSPAEARRIVGINLRAGLRAKAAGAFASAAHYLAAGLRQLGPEPFALDYATAFTLHLECAASEFLNADGGRAEHLIDTLLRHIGSSAETVMDRVRVLTLRIEVQIAAGRFADALHTLANCTALLDVQLDLEPDEQYLDEIAADVRTLIGARDVGELATQPPMRDPRHLALLRALAAALPAAFVLGRSLQMLLMLRIVQLTLRHGIGPGSAMGYIDFAWLCCVQEGRYKEAAAFETLALQLAERSGDSAERAAVQMVSGQFICPAIRPLREGLAMLHQAFENGRASGNPSFASFCCYAIIMRRHNQGDPLPAILEDINARIDFVNRTAVRDVRIILLLWRRFIFTMTGLGAPHTGHGGASPLADPALAAEVAGLGNNPARFVLHALGLQAHYLLGHYSAALEDAAAVDPHTATLAQVGNVHLYRALATCALTRAGAGTHDSCRTVLRAALDWFGRAAAGCPENFKAAQHLLAAEQARLDHDHEAATRAYGWAIECAHRQGMTHVCALAWELAAGCYRERGWQRQADSCMAAAIEEYERWGALAKVAQLRAAAALPPANNDSDATSWRAALPPSQLDLMAVAKAAQHISSETSSARLHESLLRIVLEHAGAQSAQLLLLHDGQLRLEASAEFEPGGFRARVPQSLPLEAAPVPHSLIDYVLKTRKPLVLGDACLDERFSQDDYLRTRLQCSVLCMPIQHAHVLAGVLYAENTHLADAFANASLDVLELLVSQAAISLENASLVAHLRESQQLLSAVMDNVPAGVYVKDLEGRYLYINQETEKHLGMDQAQVLGKRDADLFPEDPELTQVLNEDDRAVVQQGRAMTFEENLRLPGGQLHTFLSVKAPLYRDSRVQGLCGISTDVSEQRRARERIDYMARYDALTGLPNRSMLIDRLDGAIASARRRDSRVAILFLDLDRFKAINDSLGHWAGDLLLKEVAQRLRGAVREADTVARLAGDEFIVLLAEVHAPEHAKSSADKLVAAIGAPFQLSGHQVSVGTSIGISMYPHDGTDPETLLKHADMAMYHAKQGGRSACQFYDVAMNQRAQERLSIENHLRGALANGELFLDYQPQVNLADRRIAGAEALLRWRHPGRGMVPPSQFIPIAEDCGLIAEITRWVLDQVCQQMRCWRDAGVRLGSLAVNVSALSLSRDDLCADVSAALDQYHLDGTCLELEMTEGILMRDAESSIDKLHDLKRLGVRLAIDDFGTGYSSLSYLKRLPVDKLKIDQSFVRDIAHDTNDSAITSTIIAMAKNLNLKVIAEGVEDTAAERFLCEHQCDQIQGFLVSRPVAPDALTAMLAR